MTNKNPENSCFALYHNPSTETEGRCTNSCVPSKKYCAQHEKSRLQEYSRYKILTDDVLKYPIVKINFKWILTEIDNEDYYRTQLQTLIPKLKETVELRSSHTLKYYSFSTDDNHDKIVNHLANLLNVLLPIYDKWKTCIKSRKIPPVPQIVTPEIEFPYYIPTQDEKKLQKEMTPRRKEVQKSHLKPKKDITKPQNIPKEFLNRNFFLDENIHVGIKPFPNVAGIFYCTYLPQFSRSSDTEAKHSLFHMSGFIINNILDALHSIFCLILDDMENSPLNILLEDYRKAICPAMNILYRKHIGIEPLKQTESELSKAFPKLRMRTSKKYSSIIEKVTGGVDNFIKNIIIGTDIIASSKPEYREINLFQNNQVGAHYIVCNAIYHRFMGGLFFLIKECKKCKECENCAPKNLIGSEYTIGKITISDEKSKSFLIPILNSEGKLVKNIKATLYNELTYYFHFMEIGVTFFPEKNPLELIKSGNEYRQLLLGDPMKTSSGGLIRNIIEFLVEKGKSGWHQYIDYLTCDNPHIDSFLKFPGLNPKQQLELANNVAEYVLYDKKWLGLKRS